MINLVSKSCGYLKEQAFTRIEGGNRINALANFCLIPLNTVLPKGVIRSYTADIGLSDKALATCNKVVAFVFLMPGTILGVALKAFNHLCSNNYRKQIQDIREHQKDYPAGIQRLFSLRKIKEIPDIGTLHIPDMNEKPEVASAIFKGHPIVRGRNEETGHSFFAIAYTQNDHRPFKLRDGRSYTIKDQPQMAVVYFGSAWHSIQGTQQVPCYMGMGEGDLKVLGNLIHEGHSSEFNDFDGKERSNEDGSPIYTLGAKW